MANPRLYAIVAAGSSSYGISPYAPTLAGAKIIGAKIAKREAWRGKREAWRGKWNLLFICISIRKMVSTGYYGKAILNMYVPVRGSGARADHIIDVIKKQHGVKPFVWTRK
jgi:hypothetical protein